MKKTKRGSKDPDAGLKTTPEFMAFEDATKTILKVPKSEVDRLLEDERIRNKLKREPS